MPDRPEILRRCQANDFVGNSLERRRNFGRRDRHRGDQACWLVTADGPKSRGHGRAGGTAVVDDHDGPPRNRHRRTNGCIALSPVSDLAALPGDLRAHVVLAVTFPGGFRGVNRTTLVNGTDGVFGVAGRPELAYQYNVKVPIQGIRNDPRHRHRPAGYGQHERPPVTEIG